MTPDEQLERAKFLVDFSQNIMMPCLREATARAIQLSICLKFKRAPWRRKVKILGKETDRCLSKFGVHGFDYMFDKNVPRERMNRMLDLRVDVACIFLKVVNFSMPHSSLGSTHHGLLDKPFITNKEGSKLSRLARRKGSLIMTEDVRMARKIEGFKVMKVPVRARYHRETNAYYSYGTYWEGVKLGMEIERKERQHADMHIHK